MTSDFSPIISFEGVTKIYGNGKKTVKAVDNVTLSIEKGEIFGVIGQSGAGKSTLVRLINQLEPTSSGKLTVDGVEGVGSLKETDLKALRRDIGMIFQHFNLFGAKSVAKNVEFPLKLVKGDDSPSKTERIERVDELLKFVGLSEKSQSRPSELSGGQQQRVGIARALATNPHILLADEATSALDPETTLDVLRLLKKVNQELGITIVVITHTMSVVRMICDRVAVMDEGKVVEIGTASEILEHPTHSTTKRFVDVIHALETGSLSDSSIQENIAINRPQEVNDERN
jgi:D-methionine transport system ATP-binding protein